MFLLCSYLHLKPSARLGCVYSAASWSVTEAQRFKELSITDWLTIAYIALFSTLLSRLTALTCGSTWVTSFLERVFWISTKVLYLSAGMAGATWNCCRLSASSVYTIQPCSMSLHTKPHAYHYYRVLNGCKTPIYLLTYYRVCVNW